MNTFSLKRATTVIALSFITCTASAQWHGDGVQRSESYISLTGLTRIPELHTDMPLDCLIGYIAMDSIARTGGIQEVIAQAQNTLIPELRVLARYMYAMTDYDPILLNRHFLSTKDSSFPNVNYQSYYANSYFTVMTEIDKRQQEFGRDYGMLVIADYVLRLRVLDVRSGIDTTHRNNARWTNVACEVREIFKGHRLPNNCGLPYPVQIEGKDIQPGPCLIYGHRTTSGPQYVPQPGDEIIVFLNLVIDKGNMYMVYPRFGSNITGGRFIIRNGRVDDPDNTWGLGPNPTLEEFRTTLLKKVDDIRSWTE